MATPSSTCGSRVGAGTVTFPCSLPDGHGGPHYAVENAASVRTYERWKQAQAYASSPLAQFQGPAQTTAERYTENPSPVPQSTSVLRQDALDAIAERVQDPPPPEAVEPVVDPLADFGTPVFQDEEQDLRLWALKSGSFMASDWEGNNIRVVQPTVLREFAEQAPAADLVEQDVQAMIIADLSRGRESGQWNKRTPAAAFTLTSAANQAYLATMEAVVAARALMELASLEPAPITDPRVIRDQTRLREALTTAFLQREGQQTQIADLVDLVITVLLGQYEEPEAHDAG